MSKSKAAGEPDVYVTEGSSFEVRPYRLRTLPKNFPPRTEPINTFHSLSSMQIILCIIQAIWTHHWTFIFHDTPFLPDTIILAATRILQKLDAEQTLHLEL
ncbi:hypothetical protein BDF21DRAFT_459962 [Thamnidium elegans]|nr:hypothetical protein BDF21DRAFT_459962 [Thamnidium elegans]